jgi:hypothetical protein
VSNFFWTNFFDGSRVEIVSATPIAQKHWWKIVVLALEIYLILASPVTILLWNNGDKYSFGFPLVAYLFWEAFFPLLLC